MITLNHTDLDVNMTEKILMFQWENIKEYFYDLGLKQSFLRQDTNSINHKKLNYGLCKINNFHLFKGITKDAYKQAMEQKQTLVVHNSNKGLDSRIKKQTKNCESMRKKQQIRPKNG